MSIYFIFLDYKQTIEMEWKIFEKAIDYFIQLGKNELDAMLIQSKNNPFYSKIAIQPLVDDESILIIEKVDSMISRITSLDSMEDDH
jgi:hypothetical protein